jgi:hypothetical protein
LTVRERTLTAKTLSDAASVVFDFSLFRRECSLAGTIFSSGFVVVQPDTGMFLRVLKSALPVEFLRTKTFTQKRFSNTGPLSQVADAGNSLHVALLLTSLANEGLSSGFRTLTEAGKSQKGRDR